MKTAIIQAYLNFAGRCDEAMAFYQQVIGAEEVMTMRFKDSPEESPMPLPDGWGEKVMHCVFKVGESLVMASDGCGDSEAFSGISLSLTLPDEEAARKAFGALAADGGKVTMPIGPTFWSPCFGMVADQFGLHWMVTVPPTEDCLP